MIVLYILPPLKKTPGSQKLRLKACGETMTQKLVPRALCIWDAYYPRPSLLPSELSTGKLFPIVLLKLEDISWNGRLQDESFR